MPGPALEILQVFRAAESDRRYSALIDHFADDVVLCEPFLGTFRGRDAVSGHLTRMEAYVPKSIDSFEGWHVEADTFCGWSEWEMVVRTATGKRVVIPGQSLYRLRDEKVTFWASYVDTRPYRRLRHVNVPSFDHAASFEFPAPPDHPRGRAFKVIECYWEIHEAGRFGDLAHLFADDSQFVTPIVGTMTGRAELESSLRQLEADARLIDGHSSLVDLAGDETVAWAQWWYHLPAGDVPCWTVFTLRDGEITYARDMFDMTVLRAVTSVAAPSVFGNDLDL